MTKLEIVSSPALPPQHMQPGRKKPVNANRVGGLKAMMPESPAQFVEQLLIFDARMLDKQTQHELLRILPELVHIRRAWKAHYLENGCLGCQAGRKPDPTYKIAANLRRAGMPWKRVFEFLTLDHKLTKHERVLIHAGVSNRMKALAKRKNGLPKFKGFRQRSEYGAGGLCMACQVRILGRMHRRYRKSMEGRNIQEELAILKDALCLRYNAAQRLFNGEE